MQPQPVGKVASLLCRRDAGALCGWQRPWWGRAERDAPALRAQQQLAEPGPAGQGAPLLGQRLHLLGAAAGAVRRRAACGRHAGYWRDCMALPHSAACHWSGHGPAQM